MCPVGSAVTGVPAAASFRCGIDYHAPADCDTVRRWLTKCADDSETANYISANTKDVSRHLLRSHFTQATVPSPVVQLLLLFSEDAK